MVAEANPAAGVGYSGSGAGRGSGDRGAQTGVSREKGRGNYVARPRPATDGRKSG
jgi:hypothetical protein